MKKSQNGTTIQVQFNLSPRGIAGPCYLHSDEVFLKNKTIARCFDEKKLFQAVGNFTSGLQIDPVSGASKQQSRCPICLKMVSVLDRHIRIHSGEKPFACHLCDYRSNQSSNLNSHIRKKHAIISTNQNIS